MTYLNELAAEIQSINTANGWNITRLSDWADDYKIPALLALIHSEVSEALEDFRKNHQHHFDEEIADVIIRCLDLCAGLEIDIDKAVIAKLEKNRTRGYKHGGKRV